MAKRGTSPKYQKYLNSRMRIKNKTKNLEKRISKIKDEKSKENFIKSCKIGREKEGFAPEKFKFNPPKIKKVVTKNESKI